MLRAVLIALGIFIHWTLTSIGIAHAQDFNAAENAAVINPPSFDVNSVVSAPAQNAPLPNATQDPVVVAPQHFEVNSSFDADSLGDRSANFEATFAPFGNDANGLRFRATADADWYRFIVSQDPRVLGQGHEFQAGLLAGYGISLERFSVTGLVGPAFGELFTQGVRTNRWGAQAVIEMYATPTDWSMASGSVSYSTIGNYLQVQAKAGVKILGGVYFGPEAKFSWQHILPFQVDFFTPAVVTATPVSPQTNINMTHLGAHLSALNIGPLAFGISGGWAHSSQLGSGYYGSASLYVPF